MGLPYEVAFGEIAVPDVPPKPRERGITMISESVIGLYEQADIIAAFGHFIDLAKIAVGASRLIPRDYLAKKIALYKENGIQAFPGGQFLEMAVLQGKVGEYFAAARAVGYECVEVSDGNIDLSRSEKARLIGQAVDAGLTVLGEAGKRVETTDPQEMIEDIQNMLRAGAWKILVAHQEIFGEKPDPAAIERLRDALDASRLIFELPVWSGARETMQAGQWLLRTFGRQVNMGNVKVDGALTIALLRLNAGPGIGIT